MRKIYYSDNLPVLRNMNEESVDLIYLDPPFNSDQAYNIIYPEDEIQTQAFADTWSWGQKEETYLKELAQLHIKALDIVHALIEGLGKIQLCAYLINMTIRLAEMHRILKSTGSLYLHCDPTASHYLKIVLDSIFGQKNFRNEIVWNYYNKFGVGTRAFGRNYDQIFFYTKSNRYPFHPQREARPKPVKQLARENVNGVLKNKRDENGHLIYRESKDKKVDSVWSIPCLQSASPENLRYPTQKPLLLLERIVKASSNKGDLILDPFCGCGTTIVAAEKLGRKWVGIDITYAAVAAIRERFRKEFNKKEGKSAIPKDIWEKIEIVGKPATRQDVEALIRRSQSSLYVRKEFEKFIVTQIGGLPNDKMGADGGIDGIISLSTKHRAVILVKSGRVNVEQICALRGLLDDQKYVAGVFVTLQTPTQPMMDFASQAGQYTPQSREELSFASPFPKIQILTVQEILSGTLPTLPYRVTVRN